MSTITAQDVLNAYKTTGCRPVRGRFVDKDQEGVRCLCALSVLYQATGEIAYRDLIIEDSFVEVASKKLGVSYLFAAGIIRGWDGVMPETLTVSQDDRNGYAVGREAFQLVEKEFGHITDRLMG